MHRARAKLLFLLALLVGALASAAPDSSTSDPRSLREKKERERAAKAAAARRQEWLSDAGAWVGGHGARAAKAAARAAAAAAQATTHKIRETNYTEIMSQAARGATAMRDSETAAMAKGAFAEGLHAIQTAARDERHKVEITMYGRTLRLNSVTFGVGLVALMFIGLPLLRCLCCCGRSSRTARRQRYSHVRQSSRDSFADSDDEGSGGSCADEEAGYARGGRHARRWSSRR